MSDKNVTQSTRSGFNDDEILPVTKCVCGVTFEHWKFSIGLGRESAQECPECGRKLYFELTIQIYEVIE